MTLVKKILSSLSLGMIALVFTFQVNANDDWTWYHGNDSATRYSTLSDINKGNIGDLNVAWIHQPGAIEQGYEATPVVIGGVMYTAGSYNRVFALDAATGKEIWHFF
ncbi:MAG: Quinoprotein glucose dehydrogenase, partial [Alphaproteobacteria bacterium MarineAlpha9_Bin1]